MSISTTKPDKPFCIKMSISTTKPDKPFCIKNSISTTKPDKPFCIKISLMSKVYIFIMFRYCLYQRSKRLGGWTIIITSMSWHQV